MFLLLVCSIIIYFQTHIYIWIYVIMHAWISCLYLIFMYTFFLLALTMIYTGINLFIHVKFQSLLLPYFPISFHIKSNTCIICNCACIAFIKNSPIDDFCILRIYIFNFPSGFVCCPLSFHISYLHQVH